MKSVNYGKKRLLSVLLSLLMILSVISFPTIKAKAAGTLDDFVERCYMVTLGRGSDPAGFADWKNQLVTGQSVGAQVAYGFVFSKEYKNRNRTNEEYVKDLYKLFMDRDPDEGGFNDWVGKLNSGVSREEVYVGFVNSQEFYNICDSYGITAGAFYLGYDRNQVNNVNLFVNRLYDTCLGRRGDRKGQQDWVKKLLNKEISGIECARCFVQSKEYVNKNLSNEQYVENLYIAMMGRASDAEGKASWVNALASGTKTRDEVFAGFANSEEFGNICATYKIDKGSYTAKDKAVNNSNNNQNNQNNNQNNNNQSNNQNNNNQNNNQNNNNQNNNQNNQNNNQNNTTPEKHTGYRLRGIHYGVFVRWAYRNFQTGEYSSGTRWDEYDYVFTYDDGSKEFPVLIEKVNKADGKVEEKTQLEMNSNGLPVKKTIFDQYGDIRRTEEYYYNDKGQLEEVRVPQKGLTINNKPIEYKKMAFWYDDKGRVIKTIVYADDLKQHRELYEYDSNGLLKSQQYEHYDSQNLKWVNDGKDVFQYSDSNRKATVNYGNNGYRVTEFNSRGDMINQKEYIGDGTLNFDYNYEYEKYEYYGDENVYKLDQFSPLSSFFAYNPFL